MRACLKRDVYEVVQFLYKDGIDGPETCEHARSLGLSTNRFSKLWEIETIRGWKIVNHTDWILYDGKHVCTVVKNEDICIF